MLHLAPLAKRSMAAFTKTITVSLSPGESIYKTDRVIALRQAGWQVVLIIPQGKNARGFLVCEIQMLLVEKD